MNNHTKILAAAVLVLLLLGAGTTFWLINQKQNQAAQEAFKVANASQPERIKQVEPMPPPPETTPAPPPANPQPRRQKPGLVDPTARAALVLVGVDDTATDYWMSAINDPKLPVEERKDLIEDLNENGFTNNKRPTVEDLPLIEIRIALIETLAPGAMDKDNADAFQEAYKDLTNMRARLTGQPNPPKRNLIPR